jgi:O-antigen/teichoic acid export membrane protein
MKTLHQKTMSATKWSALDVFLRQGAQFAVSIVLARILVPEDFGVVAMLALFVGVAGIFIDSGFSSALIQRQTITHTDESTVFFFNLGMGAVVALLLCLAAPWIAAFFKQPILIYLSYAMALNLFLSALASIHITLLTKEMNFKTIAKVGGIASLVSGILAIVLASQGFGVWSLVGQALMSSAITVLLLWVWHPWRPTWTFSFVSLSSFFRFGGYLLWTGLLSVINTNLYALLVGKLHSVQEVGFYSQAQRLQQFPVSIMSNVVGRVVFPAFAAVAEDKVSLARMLRKSLISAMFINVPLMLGLIVLAEPLVLVLFGEKWLPSVPVMQVLAIVGMMWPFHLNNVNVLIAQGHTSLNARIELIKLTVAITLLILTSPFGILAIAYGQVLASLLAFFVNTHYSKVMLDYGGFAQIRDIAPYVLSSLPMVLVVWLITRLMYNSVQLELVVAVLAGGLTYLAICKMARLEGIDYLLALWKRSK